MTKRDKEKIRVLINEAKVWCDSHEEISTVLDDDCEEIPFHCLEVKTVKMLLDQLKEKLLKDDVTDEFDGIENHLRECPYCRGHNSKVRLCPGDGNYYPASAYVECLDCGTRGREFEGNDIDDIVLRATVAWNRRL